MYIYIMPLTVLLETLKLMYMGDVQKTPFSALLLNLSATLSEKEPMRDYLPLGQEGVKVGGNRR
jgi:hypothetical protein